MLVDGIDAWCPRLTAAMILSGSAVQVKGLGSRLVSATKRLIVAWRSTTHRKTPRFNRRFASLAKKPSTALSHEQEVGVKWKVKRGCRSSHCRTFGHRQMPQGGKALLHLVQYDGHALSHPLRGKAQGQERPGRGCAGAFFGGQAFNCPGFVGLRSGGITDTAAHGFRALTP